MGVDAKHQKNGKKSFQNQIVSWRGFLKDFGANLGGFWCQVEPKKTGFFGVFSKNDVRKNSRLDREKLC